MLNEVIKHQSMVRINKHFISSLKHKYDKISVGAYFIERMLLSGVDTGYLCSNNRDMPFCKIVEDNKNFQISLTDKEHISTQQAILYSDCYGTPGLTLSKARNGFSYNIIPLYRSVKRNRIMLLSFFNGNEKIKNYYGEDIFSDKVTIKSSYRFPTLLEYVLNMLKYGHVHIAMDNNILLKDVDLDDIDYYPKSNNIF